MEQIEISLTDAGLALRNHFGEQLSAGHDEGRRMMREALEVELHIDSNRAKKLVEALEAAHSVRWVPGRRNIPPAAPVNPDVGSAAPPPAPAVVGQYAAADEGGYWQL